MFDEVPLYPFTLVFPHKKRTFFLVKEEDRNKWVKFLRDAIGYADFFEFYEELDVVGNGKFGLVKLAKYKKTSCHVAVKILRKSEMTNKDLEL